jgi:hypothetical protein
MSNLEEKDQQKYAALLSKDASKLTMATAEELGFMDEAGLDTMAKKLGYKTKDEMATALNYNSIAEMLAAFYEVSDKANKEFTKLSEEAQKRDINIKKEFLEQASVG